MRVGRGVEVEVEVEGGLLMLGEPKGMPEVGAEEEMAGGALLLRC